LLVTWKNELLHFADIHTNHENLYCKKEVMISVPIILLSSSLGITSFLEIKDSTYNIITGIFSISITVLTSLHKYFRYSILEDTHKRLAVKYTNLANDILYELSLEEKDRKPVDAYLTIVKDKMERLLQESPTGIK